jgi:predicted secreted Zn-dependent protease
MACVRLSVRLAGAMVLCSAADISAQDSLIIKTNFFNVSGVSERELRRSISQARPWKDKPEGDATTAWRIEWTFKVTSSETACHIQSFSTRTTVTMTFPKWTPPSSAPQALAERWEGYLTALKTHEEGHKQIALAAAAEIQRRVKALKSEPTCEALSTSMTSTAQAVLAEYRQKEIEYDRTTQHGAAQGARFP